MPSLRRFGRAGALHFLRVAVTAACRPAACPPRDPRPPRWRRRAGSAAASRGAGTRCARARRRRCVPRAGRRARGGSARSGSTARAWPAASSSAMAPSRVARLQPDLAENPSSHEVAGRQPHGLGRVGLRRVEVAALDELQGQLQPGGHVARRAGDLDLELLERGVGTFLRQQEVPVHEMHIRRVGIAGQELLVSFRASSVIISIPYAPALPVSRTRSRCSGWHLVREQRQAEHRDADGVEHRGDGVAAAHEARIDVEGPLELPEPCEQDGHGDRRRRRRRRGRRRRRLPRASRWSRAAAYCRSRTRTAP